MSIHIHKAVAKVHKIANGVVCKVFSSRRAGSISAGHVCNGHIWSLQFDFAQADKVHFSECNTSSLTRVDVPVNLCESRPEVVGPSQNGRVDLEKPEFTLAGESSYTFLSGLCHCTSDTRERKK